MGRVTDEERREAARRLRGLEVCELDGEFIDCGEVEVALGLVSDDGAWYEAEGIMRLADLIEPSDSAQTVAEDMFGQMRHSTEQERIAYADMMARNSVGLHTVDRDALLALAKVLGGMGDRYNEHERYELGTTFKAIADRIREACGVTADV